MAALLKRSSAFGAAAVGAKQTLHRTGFRWSKGGNFAREQQSILKRCVLVRQAEVSENCLNVRSSCFCGVQSVKCDEDMTPIVKENVFECHVRAHNGCG
ncbi:hypothetical protein F2P81_019678 [Scophthalmus maximus]|uniref:Uncharacterized protein n=1 Tax=Scophthalmus maximus TaxID=52904 RepID=A0A6A4SBX3_SCOMX|nr:hypothetical protein F2P81_019678 [Scophthalmus maximus]